jgi:hypothetical protein
MKDIVGSAKGSWETAEAARLPYSVSRSTAPDLTTFLKQWGRRNQFRETPSTETDGEFAPRPAAPGEGSKDLISHQVGSGAVYRTLSDTVAVCVSPPPIPVTVTG